jgi:hypothetical protein
MNKNDEKILELKSQIIEKKKSVIKSKRFIPITNCSIELDGIRYNIQTLDKESCISLLVKLNSYKLSAKDLDLLEEYKISGFKIEEWIEDIKLKLDVLLQREEEKKLHSMEKKLEDLLSNEKKIEIEIADIESMLK